MSNYCRPILKKTFNNFYVKNKFSIDQLYNKKILVIRPDRLGDMCVSFPLVFLLSKFVKQIDWWINGKFEKLGKRLIKEFNLPNVNIITYELNDREDFFGYSQEKHDKFLRLKQGLKFVFSKDFFGLIKLFKDYDIIFDLVGKRRFQILMFLSKILKKKKIAGLNKSLTDKFLDSVLYRGDYTNIVDQILSFINIDLVNFKDKFFKRLKNGLNKDYILIHIGYGGEKSRNWGLENWQLLINKLLQTKKEIKVVYSFPEKKEGDYLKSIFLKVDNIQFVFNPSLDSFFDLVKNCNYFIGIDSGPFHLADILGKKGVVLFSRENEKNWGPRNPQMKAIKKFKGICLRRNCNLDYCIKLINPDDVLKILAKDLKLT